MPEGDEHRVCWIRLDHLDTPGRAAHTRATAAGYPDGEIIEARWHVVGQMGDDFPIIVVSRRLIFCKPQGPRDQCGAYVPGELDFIDLGVKPKKARAKRLARLADRGLIQAGEAKSLADRCRISAQIDRWEVDGLICRDGKSLSTNCLPSHRLDFQRVVVAHGQARQCALAGHPVPYQCVADHRITTAEDGAAIDEMGVCITVHMKSDFAVAIVPTSQRLDPAAAQRTILSVLDSDRVFFRWQMPGQHNLAR